MRFWTFTDAFGSFRRFRRVATCYNWASSNAVASSSCLQTVIRVKVLHRCDETSLTNLKIGKSAQLSSNHHNFSNTEPIYTK